MGGQGGIPVPARRIVGGTEQVVSNWKRFRPGMVTIRHPLSLCLHRLSEIFYANPPKALRA